MSAPSTTAAGAPATGSRPVAATGAGFATAAMQVALRTVRKFVRTPQLIVVSTVQGAMFLLIFRYVFGGAISSGGVPYVDFLVPGFITTSILFSGMNSSSGVAEDIEQGFVDRLRSLPVPRLSILAGRALADTALTAWALVVTAAIGFLVGFRLHGSIGAGLLALALCVLYGFAFTWLFITIGLVAGSAQAAQGMSLLVFPFTFVSSAYVPIETMPGWLQAFARNQPLTTMIDAVRDLALDRPDAAHHVAVSLVWAVALIAVFAPLAVARFRRA
jgi:ABC transporter DrrB family efflux protein